MKKWSRWPVVRFTRACLNRRYTRRCNFRINTNTLRERQAMVEEEAQLRMTHPEKFARADFYGGPFSGR